MRYKVYQVNVVSHTCGATTEKKTFTGYVEASSPESAAQIAPKKYHIAEKLLSEQYPRGVRRSYFVAEPC